MDLGSSGPGFRRGKLCVRASRLFILNALKLILLKMKSISCAETEQIIQKKLKEIMDIMRGIQNVHVVCK